MKNSFISNLGSSILNVGLNAAGKLAKSGVRSIMCIPDAVGNMLKIYTYKNHNICIRLFMRH